MFLTTSLRSRLAVPVLVALVGSLLALSAAPAIGRNGEADDRPLYSACLGNALGSAGYRDVPSGSVSEDAINCMTHYGIMEATSQRRFLPTLGVTRQQMALFLVRAAGPAGIEVPRARDQGFRDIAGLPREVRDSINQIAELGITMGTTTSTFVPDTVVNRRQMAQFLTRFLDLASIGEGGVHIDAVNPDDTQFIDIRDLPHDPYDAIRLLYELGVTTGTTATTFGPNQPVTRAQMALFISRMLAHTNARPVGVTMQVEETSLTSGDTVDLVISVRDDDHQPVDDAPVDLFYVAEGDNGFASTGRCGSKAVLEEGDVRCSIDSGDETTNADGNLTYRMTIDEGLEVYAWTGASNNRFDLDRTDYASLVFEANKGPAYFLLTDDLPEGAIKALFGTTVTFTFQLVDEDKNPVREEDAELRIQTVEDNDNRTPVRRTRNHDTDELGQVELDFRLPDPNSRRDNPDGELRMDVLDEDYDVIDETKVRILTGSNRLRWSDEDDEATTLLLDQTAIYSPATDSGSGGRNRVTATLLDQYGYPIRNEEVHFTSDDGEGLWHDEDDADEAKSKYRDRTSGRGVATVTYRRDSDQSGIENIVAFTDEDVDADLRHYWVEDIPDGDTVIGEVLDFDKDRDAVVIEDNSGTIYAITYDDGDQFNDADGTLRYKDFEEELDKGDTLKAGIDTNHRDAVNRFTLT